MKSPFTIFRRPARAFDAPERIDGDSKASTGCRHTAALETHSRFAAPRRLARSGPKWVWSHGHKNLGASVQALERLGREKGYALGGCDFAGTNGFFVRQELVTEELFLPPYTSEQHFEPKKRIFFTPKRPPTQDDASSFFNEND